MGESEYAANVVAAVKYSRDQNDGANKQKIRWKVFSIPSTTYKDSNGDVRSTGVIDLEALDDILAGKRNTGCKLLDPESICMVCITHIPINSGIINPVNDIGELIQEYNNKWTDEVIFT